LLVNSGKIFFGPEIKEIINIPVSFKRLVTTVICSVEERNGVTVAQIKLSKTPPKTQAIAEYKAINLVFIIFIPP